MVTIRVNASGYTTPVELRIGEFLITAAGTTIEDTKFYNLAAATRAQLAELVRQGKIVISKDSDALSQTQVTGAEISLFSLLPKLTTTEKNAIANPSTGFIVYDTSLNKLCFYNGSVWETVTSA